MKEIFGVGIDMEDVDRFEKVAHNTQDPFLRRIYTSEELAYCFKKARPAQALAARFAAKEAIMKALYGRFGTLDYRNIEIARFAGDAPLVILPDDSAKEVVVQISFSHTATSAIAIAIAYKGAKR